MEATDLKISVKNEPKSERSGCLNVLWVRIRRLEMTKINTLYERLGKLTSVWPGGFYKIMPIEF